MGEASTAIPSRPAMHSSARAHGQPALADVVARPHEPGPDRGVEAAVAGRRVGIGLRRDTGVGARRAGDEVEVAAGELGSVVAEQQHDVAGAVSSAVTQRPTSGTWATAVITSVGGTAWRRPSAPVYSLFSESLPDTNGAPWATAASWQPSTAATSSPSVARRGVAPREVVEQGDPVGVGADGDDVADRLVDDGVGHRLGIVQAVPRVDADADGDAVGVPGVGEHHAVAGPVAVAPTSGRTTVPPPISWS